MNRNKDKDVIILNNNKTKIYVHIKIHTLQEVLFCLVIFSKITVVESFSCVWLFAIPWTAAPKASLSFTISWSLLKLMSIELMMPSSHLILCHPLLLLPAILPSIRVFPNESTLYIRWPKYWSFCFSISPSNEYSELISFRIDWFDLLAVKGTLKSLLPLHNSKAAILRHSTFFIVQISYPYMITGKTTASLHVPLLTKWCLCLLIHCLGLS